jgi:hypothetical protein
VLAPSCPCRHNVGSCSRRFHACFLHRRATNAAHQASTAGSIPAPPVIKYFCILASLGRGPSSLADLQQDPQRPRSQLLPRKQLACADRLARQGPTEEESHGSTAFQNRLVPSSWGRRPCRAGRGSQTEIDAGRLFRATASDTSLVGRIVLSRTSGLRTKEEKSCRCQSYP